MTLRSRPSCWSFFADDHTEVSRCTSLAEIQAALDDYPNAIVVSDCWSHDSRGQVSTREYDQIVALGRVATVIVTTGRSWSARASELPLEEGVVAIPKPYDVDQLLDAIREAASDSAKNIVATRAGNAEP